MATAGMNRPLGIGCQVVGHRLLDEGRLRIAIWQHGTQRNVLYDLSAMEVKYVGKSTQMLQAPADASVETKSGTERAIASAEAPHLVHSPAHLGSVAVV